MQLQPISFLGIHKVYYLSLLLILQLLFLHTSILVSKNYCQESPPRTPETMITR